MSSDPAAHVRHELRTPLNHIIGYSELLLDEASERGRAELEPGLHQILDDARALLVLINELLAASKLGAGVAALRQMPAELATPLKRIVATCAGLQPQFAGADAADLVPDLERIGLAAKHFLTLVRDGVGPAEPGSFAEDAPRVAAVVAAKHGVILVVDDNETNRDMLSRRLAREGYQVHLAAGGRQAFELLATQAVDLILLDVMMPEMNGYDALQRLKANPAQRDIPVLMISALDEMDSVVRCIELGAEDYLFKPFDPVLLRARIGACLEKKRLRDEVARHVRRMERELEMARAIQLSMVPTDFSIAGPAQGLALYATLQPAYEVGGDLYDFFWMTPERMCLVVADVSDKGASAALFMARAKTVTRLLAMNFGHAAGNAPTAAELVMRIDAELCQDNPYAMFVTLLLCIVDARTGAIEWCSAGHNPPYLIAPDGTTTQLAGDSGIPIGIDAELPRVADTAQLAAGGSFFAYTDGVSEAMNEHNAMFGTPRLEAALRSCGGHAPQDMVNAVLQQVKTFAGAAAASDDIAMLACRWRG